MSKETKKFEQQCMDAAAHFLAQKDYEILERGWKSKSGKHCINFIAKDEDGVLHFIEVHGRCVDAEGEAEGFNTASVYKKNRIELEQVAELYCMVSDDILECRITFDIISIHVYPNDRAMLQFYRNVLSTEAA